MSEITLIIKPIMFEEIKHEITIKINPDLTPIDLIEKINIKEGNLGTNMSFLFRGKKLSFEKTLKEQNITKDNLKLLMNRTKEPQFIQSAKNNEINNTNNNINNNNLMNDNSNLIPPHQIEINEAKNYLLEKYKNNLDQMSLINSLLKTMPHIENMSSNEIIEKIEQFISTVTQKTVKEYILNLNKNEKFDFDENSLTSIFTMGNGTNGQLGINSYIITNHPLRLNLLRKIKIIQISCGICHTIALSENNTIYSWGRLYKTYNKNDKNKSEYGDYSEPKLIESLVNEIITYISTGNNHSMALTNQGDLYTWGEGIYGQLGHGIKNNETYPRKLNVNNLKIINMKGGSCHTLAACENGFLLGWGNNEKNQLGLNNIKDVDIPYLLTLYELNNNFTVEEYRFLNRKNDENNENNINLNINDLSTNIEDLMKVNLITCGTWFSAFTSQLFPNDIYIMGNNYKRTIKINYFEINKIDIKQIVASSNFLFVLTEKDGIFKINTDDLDNEKVPIENLIENINIIEVDKDKIKKIEVGLNYILTLTNSNECFYTDIKIKNEYKTNLLNKEIKTNIYDISSGHDHLFLMTKLNSFNYCDLLYETIKNYLKNKDDDSSFDIFLCKNENSIIIYPCHSYIIEQFIDLSKLKNISGKKYIIEKLSENEIEIMIELIYTDNINWNLYDYESIIILIEQLNHIKEFLFSVKIENQENQLLDLIDLYKEKYNKIFLSEQNNASTDSKNNKNMAILSGMLNTTYRKIVLELTNIQNNNNNRGDNNNNNNNNNNRGDNNNNNNNNNNIIYGPLNPFPPNNLFPISQQNKNKTNLKNLEGGTVIGESYTNVNQELNIENYKKYKEEIENSYSFYKKISEIRKILSNKKIEYIQKNIKSNFSFEIKLNDNEIISINKDILSFKSVYFYNLIKIMNEKTLNLKDINLNFSEENFRCLIEFLHTSKFNINQNEIINILDLSSFFMIDNVISLIEIQLEQIIDSENILCLIEIGKDYNLTYLYRSCLIYIIIHLNEIKDKGLIKYIKNEDRNNLKEFLKLNGKEI